jgi:protease IV
MKKLFNNHKQTLSIIGILVVFFLISLAGNYAYNLAPLSLSSPTEDYYYGCNVAGIELRGDLYTYVPTYSDGSNVEGYEDAISSDEIAYYISQAEYDDNIQAILIEVDSYGGSPVAAEEVATEIMLATKPVVAFIREGGVSAAYMAISPADRIFASKSSDVGGLGVTMSYLDYSNQNQKEGVSYVQLSTGKFKDSGSPDKPITEEERNLFMRDLQIIHENFITTVSENRGIALEKVRAMADGSTVLGEQAKELGLIDGIGGYNEAVTYLEEILGEQVSVCW